MDTRPGYRKNPRRLKILLGKSLIAGYVDWLEWRKWYDRGFERQGIVSAELNGMKVQGGDHPPVQEKVMTAKLRDREYSSLCRRIEKMSQILEGMTEEQQYLLDSFCWRGVPWYEVAKVLNRSKTSFFRAVSEVEELVGEKWENWEKSPTCEPSPIQGS